MENQLVTEPEEQPAPSDNKKPCDCLSCTLHRRSLEISARGDVDEMRKFIEELGNLWCQANEEQSILECKLRGDWPSSYRDAVHLLVKCAGAPPEIRYSVGMATNVEDLVVAASILVLLRRHTDSPTAASHLEPAFQFLAGRLHTETAASYETVRAKLKARE